MSIPPELLTGLHQIAGTYDALICDVWGVLHDGHRAHLPAVEALRRFRHAIGPVVLLSNAPRPAVDMETQFRHFGVPFDCYDAIVTSGIATRQALEARAAISTLPMLHIGPERDRGIFANLNIACVDADAADLVLCTGLWDDDRETPDDYRALLQRLRERGLVLFCANPDIVVQRGPVLVYCAGAVARLYEQLGGAVVYFGKPHRPVYDMALKAAQEAAGRPVRRPLCIGDSTDTDIRGANRVGFDALFIADGVHAAQLGEWSAQGIGQFFATPGVHAKAAMRTLAW